MLNLNQSQLETVAANASATVAVRVPDAQLARRWQNAILRALLEIETAGEFMHFDAQTNALVIWSQKSSEIYEANGVCQCKAYAGGQPCWHRAAAKLVRLCRESH